MHAGGKGEGGTEEEEERAGGARERKEEEKRKGEEERKQATGWSRERQRSTAKASADHPTTKKAATARQRQRQKRQRQRLPWPWWPPCWAPFALLAFQPGRQREVAQPAVSKTAKLLLTAATVPPTHRHIASGEKRWVLEGFDQKGSK